MSRAVVVFRPKKNSAISVSEIMDKIERYRKKHPQREVFFDGDEFAICYIRK
jgi:hypothetical protein